MNQLSCRQVDQAIQTNMTLLDVRSVEEFNDGSLPNAKNIPLDVLPEIALGQLDKNDAILIYCFMGGRADEAVKILEGLGFTDVHNIGGVEYYQQCHNFTEEPLNESSSTPLTLDRSKTMKLEQLFDAPTGTYTYLLWDEKTKQATLIDSVLEQVERDTKLIKQLGLDLKYTLETHVHADHVTGSGMLRKEFGNEVMVHESSGLKCADRLLSDNDMLELGDEKIYVMHTPGHTDTCVSFHIDGAVFTGDALLIDGCGRTDFQSGDANKLYHSITEKLFALGDETIMYPGHDYLGLTSSTIAREKAFNSRLGNNRSEADFVAIMDGLDLAPPKRIDIAVPSNMQCGLEQ